MRYKKLRFAMTCTINFEGNQIACRVIYGNFPFGYGKNNLCLPEIVVDQNGEAYRPRTISSSGPWCAVNAVYLKRLGLTKKQIGVKA